MSTEENATSTKGTSRGISFAKVIAIVALIAVALLIWQWLANPGSVSVERTTAKVTRGDLTILVLEGGNLRALESLELKSQVETREGAKILSIVDEGYEVTEKDVEEKKVLIKLDPTEIKEQIEGHDIEYENAQGAVTEADEARAIQSTESEKEIKVARQTVRFALLDFEKYLGEEISVKVLSQRDLPDDDGSLAAYESGFRARLMEGMKKDENATEEESQNSDRDDIIDRGNWERVNFAKYLEEDNLGDGEAQQELRKRQDALLVATSEAAVELENVLGSERLAAREFIAKATLDKQRVALKKAQLAELSAQTSLSLFRRYEFPKNAEELLTKYEDALQSLDREKTEALAKLSQAEAKFRNMEQLFKLAQKRRKDLEKQLESCTIFATEPGLVVYGSSERNPFSGGNEATIEEGASVRFKQTMITIPDMRKMAVKVSIQESQIKKIKVGQKTRIVADAEPDKTLTGEVKKVALLPDSNRWFENPNQKIYPTEVHVDGTHDWLKPGMSVKLEIITDELKEVIKIPLQCVMVDSTETVAYAKREGKPVRQVVATGGFNDEFIEITSGLKEGELVFLSKPFVEEVSKKAAKSAVVTKPVKAPSAE